ncbi:tRNA uridine-5-carboxymethylaminomethyl(34) synthesis GTPase MnmE [Desulfosporosinus sp. Sb-LF]|uniref:tRNA uridine-5-carboxymethylaminomethyl(34) synthesis GTPase MnmE n=1 Tax=Desulfosporosinus sp. Sb-LF TaxID=2560027 RepID=UPI00107F1AC2|nr:tRNA uridine-5-carboxymethylaminomethyl(34) synthesis GTPase MnmE [Desulfosporosinus sp. Sb-LF]TGE34025.1 tRNA uridine-5-carboxymethylaminomethyl(34) synthesis GTPase MnmE [Desulfosporosinus sp. Sb-LF]
MEDTIVAIATAMAETSIHILRLSGAGAGKIIEACFHPQSMKRWVRRENFTLNLGIFSDEDRVLDQVLIGRMLEPSSFTGEDVYEINCHGGPFVAQRILQACIRHGARLAEPGEFSKRAFLNGKLDLVQAEAVIDLISSRTETAANLALTQLNGGLSKAIIDLREEILEILAFIEAGIDFPEDDVESLDRENLEVRVTVALNHIQNLLEGSKTGKILRDGLLTVIVGRPNVGKSSLLNALLHEERAIVTDIPGTTRDEIRESVSVGGILLQLVDTAGICVSEDVVERLGIERTWKALENAELILLVVQANVPLTDDEHYILRTYAESVIVLVNKIDLLKATEIPCFNEKGVWIPFSVLELRGFKELEAEISRRVYKGESMLESAPLLSNVRHISSLERCNTALTQALKSIQKDMPWDILSIDIRQAVENISEITGHNVQESLLEDIFSRFCIGK